PGRIGSRRIARFDYRSGNAIAVGREVPNLDSLPAYRDLAVAARRVVVGDAVPRQSRLGDIAAGPVETRAADRIELHRAGPRIGMDHYGRPLLRFGQGRIGGTGQRAE